MLSSSKSHKPGNSRQMKNFQGILCAMLYRPRKTLPELKEKQQFETQKFEFLPNNGRQ